MRMVKPERVLARDSDAFAGRLVSSRDAYVLRNQDELLASLPPERERVTVAIGAAKVPLIWLALGVERSWANAGSASPPREAPKGTARPR